ncbi:MAG: glycosyltransferase family 39 protein [Chloroflexi bacterium]|nr:glycosyltransferase family 39 protein [Chloroflexota bacterium]
MNITCPHCGTSNAIHHRFCHFCGSALTAAGHPAMSAPLRPNSRPRLPWRLPQAFAAKESIAGTRTWLGGAARWAGRQAAGVLAPFVAAFPAHPRPAEAATGAAGRIQPWEAAVIAALTFVALVIRVQHLETVPPGIANDEAELALEALRISLGEVWPGAWTGVTLGTPAGIVHLQALLFLFLDASIATARLSAVLPGVALIPIAYFLMRQLFSARTAVLTAAFLIFHVWILVFSRIAFPTMPAVLCFTAGVWLLIAGVRSNRRWPAALGGVLFGLGWYTYKTFPVYAIAVWGVLALYLLFNRRARSAEVAWFLGASLAVSAHIVFFYLTSDVVPASLRLYERTPLLPGALISRAWDVITYVHSPMPREGNVGTGGIPLLHFSTEVFFWIGLAALLIFIRKRSSQLLLAGWLISLVPAVLTPDAESRRYLLGIVFVLAIAAVGFDTAISLVHNRWKRYAGTVPIPTLAGWLGNAVAALALAAFVLLFAAQQDRDYQDWLVESEWALARKEVEGVRFAQSLGDGYEVRLYNDRLPRTNAVVQWFLPDRQTRNGSTAFGGSGGIDAETVRGPTVWLLAEDYLTLAPQLQAAFPHGRLTFGNSEQGELLYAAFVLDDP